MIFSMALPELKALGRFLRLVVVPLRRERGCAFKQWTNLRREIMKLDLHQWIIEQMLYPAMERCKGNRIRAMERSLNQTVYGGAEAVQRRRLAELLLYCKAHVPAYKNLNLSDATEDPNAVLCNQVPPLRKRDFQADPSAYLSDAVPEERRIANCTGGSTGEPVRFFMTRAQVESYEAARWRGLSWYGITQGSRSVMLWGNPIELSACGRRARQCRERILKNRVLLSAYDLSEARVRAHVRFLNRYRPAYLYGYANILTAFAQYLEVMGLDLSFPMKAVVSTSETLEPWQRALLEQVFRCPVADEYGARDAGILAYSCPECGGLHVTEENCVIEVLDPITLKPLPDGQRGLVAVTDLNNLVQPRLRYLLGDVGTLETAPCPCGRALRTLRTVEGREDALFLRADGGLVHGNVIGQLLRPVDGVLAFQFRQTSLTEGTLLLKLAAGKALEEKDVLEGISRVLPDVHVHVRRVSEIPPTQSGKVRYAVRDFPLPEAAGSIHPSH